MKKNFKLIVEQSGNDLVIRIPDELVLLRNVAAGQAVELSIGAGGVTVTRPSAPTLSLAEKLAAFDPKKHGGEVMAAPLVGVEKI